MTSVIASKTKLSFPSDQGMRVFYTGIIHGSSGFPMKFNKATKVLLGALTALLFASSANAQQPGSNIALGKTVTYNAKPNYYAATMDRTATGQLTDGKYVSRLSADGKDHQSFWTQNGTVGWQYVNPVFITVDLGSAQSISGVSLSTAGGRAGVSCASKLCAREGNFCCNGDK